jgi:ABC-type enterochelin transport system substrate-binding protein
VTVLLAQFDFLHKMQANVAELAEVFDRLAAIKQMLDDASSTVANMRKTQADADRKASWQSPNQMIFEVVQYYQRKKC